MKVQRLQTIMMVGFISLFVFSGCAWFETNENKSAEELAHDGMDKFDRRKYRAALESFQQLKDWHPLSRYAILAELKTGDAHFHLKNYEEAIIAYEEFEQLHPRNEAVPYVVYQIGLCYFRQLESIDRDQSNTYKALETFRRLQQQYPTSPHAQKADEHIQECIKNIAGHDIYIGEFYYKSKHYKAALSRFKKVISEYPDVGQHAKAREYIQLCEAKLKDQSAN